MFRCRVALVLRQSVAGILLIQLHHVGVAGCLRDEHAAAILADRLSPRGIPRYGTGHAASGRPSTSTNSGRHFNPEMARLIASRPAW